MNNIEKQVVKAAKIIVADNKAFNRASKAQKRVMIAQDILARIKTRQYVATTGTWVSPNFHAQGAEDDASVQKLLNEKGVQCECCGVGSVLLSCVAFKNQVTARDVQEYGLDYGMMSDKDVDDKAGVWDIFSKKQLALIEIAFEQGDGMYAPSNGNILGADPDEYVVEEDAFIEMKDYLAAKKFTARLDDPKKRLVKIMKNIVKNNGTFKV
jgi:hypothetical protein